eukprot:499816_1
MAFYSNDQWGDYGHTTHSRRKKGGKGDVVLKMNWTYELKDGRIGVLKFMGATEFEKGTWIGLELSKQFKGKHNGTVEGTKYFAVETKGQGVMIKANKVKKRVASKKGKSLKTAKVKKGALATGKADWKPHGGKKSKSEY